MQIRLCYCAVREFWVPSTEMSLTRISAAICSIFFFLFKNSQGNQFCLRILLRFQKRTLVGFHRSAGEFEGRGTISFFVKVTGLLGRPGIFPGLEARRGSKGVLWKNQLRGIIFFWGLLSRSDIFLTIRSDPHFRVAIHFRLVFHLH